MANKNNTESNSTAKALFGKAVVDNSQTINNYEGLDEEKAAVLAGEKVEEKFNTNEQEQIRKLRCNLFEEVHSQNSDGHKVVEICRELKKFLPTDFQANFYEKATIGTENELNDFLNNIDVEKDSEYITDVLDYVTNPLEYGNVAAVRYLIERAFKNKNDELEDKYNTICDESEELIKKGVYNEKLPRHVFLAYKSQDIKLAYELCDYLEQNNIKCFLSSRNLQHGRRAKNNYETKLKSAIDHCQIVVFVSTHLSRTVGDAIGFELPYIQEQDKKKAPPQYHNYLKIPKKYKMQRVEYLKKEDYVEGDVREDFAREFFKGFTYRKTPEAVYKAVEEYLRESPEDISEDEIKYCKQCGTVNKIRANFCSECGQSEFVATQKEYLAYKERQIKDQLEKENEARLKVYEEEFANKQRKLDADEKRIEEDREKNRDAQQELNRKQLEQEEEIARKQREFEKQKEKILAEERSKLEEEIRKQVEAEYREKYPGGKVETAVADNYPTLENYDKEEFVIEDTVLRKFKGNKSKVQVPQGVTSLGRYVFWDSCGLTSLTIPDSVTFIAEGAFESCFKLESIVVAHGNTKYHSSGNCLIETSTKTLILGCQNSIIPTDGSVTAIDDSAFNGCSELESITIPDSVTSIGSRAFICKNLKHVTMPKILEKYIDKAFDGERKHIEFKFTESVSSKPFTSVNYPTLENYDKEEFEIEYTVLRKFKGNKSEVQIPHGVTSIGEGAFECCVELESIMIPDSVTSIGNKAFGFCNGLKSITIPDSVTSIGNKAFGFCSELKSITIPESVTTIGKHAFELCLSLESVIMPKRLESFINNAFANEIEHIKFEFYENKQNTNTNRIKVIGVGGAGNNIINSMLETGINSVEYFVVNTDSQILSLSACENKIQIGEGLTKGLGAGADPDIGRAAAEESKEELTAAIKDTDLLFITAGMGGGTGTGAAPVIAKIARDLKILTIAVVTQPFGFEGKKRLENTIKGIENLKKYVDTLIIIPNEKIKSVVAKNTTIREVVRVADEIIKQGIKGIAELIVNPSLIKHDFADVRTILKDKGIAHLGVGVAKGDNRIVEAVRVAVNCPLLDTTIEGASGVILSVVGGEDLTFDEVADAAELVKSVVDASANIIFGARIDPNVRDEVEITVIATGFPELDTTR